MMFNLERKVKSKPGLVLYVLVSPPCGSDLKLLQEWYFIIV